MDGWRGASSSSFSFIKPIDLYLIAAGRVLQPLQLLITLLATATAAAAPSFLLS